MSGRVQVAKALGLFVAAIFGQTFVLGEQSSLLIRLLYHLALILVVYKYATSFTHSKLPPNDIIVTIVGAGVSGIAMAVKLKEIGVKIRILEKEKKLGGTWWFNQFPGCACDIASHMYSFSFFLNPNWSRSYSPQQEILRYLQDAADKFNITQHIEFDSKVDNTTWDAEQQKWVLTLENGKTVTSNVVVSAVGILHVPQIPTFPGADKFKGDKFHSAEWPIGYDVKGKTIAVIGTGASAVQIVPSVADEANQVTVLQRTACWVPPKDDFEHPQWMKLILKFYPPIMYLFRLFYFWRQEWRFMTSFRQSGMNKDVVRNLLTAYYKAEMKDPETAKKLTPNFEVGCKRITPSNVYLQSFNKENVSLVTSPIECFTENGITTKDGNEIIADTIIYATGFDIPESIKQFRAFGTVEGTKGNKITTENGRRSLADEWGDEPNAYMGITYPGYPNAFFIMGPGTVLGHNSMIFMIECQINYTIDAIKNMVHKNIKSLNVKKAVNDNYQNWVQELMKDKVYNSSACTGWYRNAAGRNYTFWPSHLTHYWWKTRHVQLNDFTCVS